MEFKTSPSLTISAKTSPDAASSEFPTIKSFDDNEDRSTMSGMTQDVGLPNLRKG
jgi:hypothetical protein